MGTQMGVQPIYVDAPNLQLWEMAPYVQMAKECGYDVVFVSPVEIANDWNSTEALLERSAKRIPSRSFSHQQLDAMIGHYQEASNLVDPDITIEQVLKEEPRDRRAIAIPGAGVKPAEVEPSKGTKRVAPAAKAPAKAPRLDDPSPSPEPMEEPAEEFDGDEAAEVGDFDEDADEEFPEMLNSGNQGGAEEAKVAAALFADLLG